MIGMRTQILSAAALVGLLCGGVLPSQALALTDTTAQKPSTARKVSPYRREKLTDSAKVYYVATWGIDKLNVSYTASGNLIRFSYRVVDARLAKPLGDVKETPSLLGQKSRAKLRIPVMEKVGQLRQTGTPQVGQEYWMVFSNKGNLVKPGDRVNVTIGIFHADGLMVE
jgi:hypothetical protein